MQFVGMPDLPRYPTMEFGWHLKDKPLFYMTGLDLRSRQQTALDVEKPEFTFRNFEATTFSQGAI